MELCIKSILDDDLYKFTTSYAYMQKYPDASGTFQFVDRNHSKISKKEFAQIKNMINELSKLYLTEDEYKWCVKNIPFIPQYYWEWLKSFRYEPERVKIWLDDNDELHIEVTDKLYKVTLYEVVILAIVSEILCAKTVETMDWDSIRTKFRDKLQIARDNNFRFSEFGTRRRFSYEVQDYIIKAISHYDVSHQCTGTSNVHLAMKYNLKPMGTHPHEWFMFHGAQFGYKHANYLALNAWQDIYKGDLGIALTDTYTSKAFFNNFTKVLAKLFDGIRHDSGSPEEFTENAIARYNELGINPLTKTIIFSDGLNFERAAELANYCKDRILCSFGIGTNLTNDVNGKPCNIVMKLINCRMNDKQPEFGCIKLSDVAGKHLGDPKEIEVAKYQLGIE